MKGYADHVVALFFLCLSRKRLSPATGGLLGRVQTRTDVLERYAWEGSEMLFRLRKVSIVTIAHVGVGVPEMRIAKIQAFVGLKRHGLAASDVL
jgi:hypothetical protein